MKKIYFYLIFVIIALSACKESYKQFDTTVNGTYFKDDSVKFSFGVTPIEVTDTTIAVPVYIMGAVHKYDREFTVTIMPDSTNATEGEEYTIGKCLIPSDSIKGYIPVTIYRNNLKGDYKTGYVYYNVCIRLTENENFKPVLSNADQYINVKFDNAIEQPNWLDYKGDKVWPGKFGVWHPYKYIKMVEYFHAYKSVNPTIYAKMVAQYGSNLDNIQYGDDHDYRTVLNKYVYKPMYDYFKANLDVIRQTYPDFPDDFQDPYAIN